MHEFITALRQLQRPLVLLAAAILLMQTLVAGVASGHGAAQVAAFGVDAVVCHGAGDDGSSPAGTAAAHDCCAFCTNPGPAVLSADAPVVARLTPAHCAEKPDTSVNVRPDRRAIRAGPSQAPPANA